MFFGGKMEDIFIHTPYGDVFGKTAGSGPLVLGLHGWSQRNGWHTWEPLMEPLAAAGFRVVSVDMPGWGQSTLAPGLAQGEKAVETVLSLLDELEGDTAVSLLGKSWGGAIAIETALSHPQRVSHLVLTAPAVRNPAQLAHLTQPVLLAWAEDDSVIPVGYGRQLAQTIPNCQLVIYPTGGHSAAPKNAAEFAPKAITFLKS